MKRQNDIFLNYPSLDIHGFDRDSAVLAVKDFISYNIKLNNKKIIVIHGKGLGILKKYVHEYLSKEKLVLNYKLDNFNDGITIIELR